MFRALPRRHVLLFVLLSAVDLLLTTSLLMRKGDCIGEGNPVADGVLQRFGWQGFVAFKLACVLTVVTIVLAVSRARPRVARRLMTFGCLALLVVVGVGVRLDYVVPSPTPEERQAIEKRRDLDAQLHQLHERLDQMGVLERQRISVQDNSVEKS